MLLSGGVASVLKGKKGEMLGEMPDTADYRGKRSAAESTAAASASVASNGSSQRRESEGRGWRQACMYWVGKKVCSVWQGKFHEGR